MFKNFSDFKNAETLTQDQLKNVKGGIHFMCLCNSGGGFSTDANTIAELVQMVDYVCGGTVGGSCRPYDS